MKRILALLSLLSDKKIVLILIIVGLFLYANSLANGYAQDDFLLIVENPLIREVNIPKFFVHGSFYDEGTGYGNNYFKPLFPTTLSIIWIIGQGSPVPFHVIQVALHILNAILVFFIFKNLLKKHFSMFLALFFLVHPINTEAVSYISSFQDTLFLCLGLSALFFSLKKDIKYTPYLVGILQFLSLLSKETGVVFIVIIPLFCFLFNKTRFKTSAIISGFVLSAYLFLRFFVSNIHLNEVTIVPVMQLSLAQRLILIPSLFLFYLKTFFFPKDLLMFHTWVIKQFSFNYFFLPLILDLSFFLLAFKMGFSIYKKSVSLFKVFLFFLVWFVAGIGLHMQIIPLDETVSDRWFYFPIIGLLGILLTFAATIHIKRIYVKKGIFICVLAVLIVFSIRVIVRNTNWKDDTTLIMHDSKANPESHQIQDALGAIYIKNNNLPEAEKHYELSTKLFPGNLTYTNLGYAYFLAKKKEESRKAFFTALTYGDNYRTYNNLSLLLLNMKDFKKAREIASKGAEKYPNYYGAWITLALVEHTLGNKQEALTAAQKGYGLNPSETNLRILEAISNGQKIELN